MSFFRFLPAVARPHFLMFAFVLAGLFSFNAFGADPQPQNQIVISVDLDGVLIRKVSGFSNNAIRLKSTGQSYEFNTALLEALYALSKNPYVKIVLNSAGSSERNNEILELIPVPGKGTNAKSIFSHVYSNSDLVPMTPELEAQKSFLYQAHTQTKNENRGYKDLNKIAKDFHVPLANIFHIDNDGRFIMPGQESQWVRTGNFKENYSNSKYTSSIMAQIYSRPLANGTIAWQVIGPFAFQRTFYAPGSATPLSNQEDYYHPMEQSEYLATRTISLDIVKNFPPDQYHYVMLGRSPTGLGRFLENIFLDAVTYLAFSGAHMPGKDVKSQSKTFYGEPSPLYRQLSEAQEKILFEYFARTLPSMKELAGKKLLIVDYYVPGKTEGLEAFSSYLKLYMERTGYDPDVVEFGILQKDLEDEAAKTFSDFPVVAKYYGQSGYPVAKQMYENGYEQVAPYGKYLPSENSPPAANSVRPQFEMFGYNMRLSMRNDAALKGLLSNTDYASFTQSAPRWLAKVSALTDLQLIRDPSYTSYTTDHIKKMPAQEKYKLMSELLSEDTNPKGYNDVAKLMLPQFEPADLAIIVPQYIYNLLNTKNGYVDHEPLFSLLEMYPEYFSSKDLLKSIPAAYRMTEYIMLLNFIERVPDRENRMKWIDELDQQFKKKQSSLHSSSEETESQIVFEDRVAALRAEPAAGITTSTPASAGIGGLCTGVLAR